MAKQFKCIEAIHGINSFRLLSKNVHIHNMTFLPKHEKKIYADRNYIILNKPIKKPN